MKYTGSWSARAMHELVLQESFNFKFGFTIAGHHLRLFYRRLVTLFFFKVHPQSA